MAQSKEGPGPGAEPVGFRGILVIMAYMVVVSTLVFYLLIKLWPYPTPDMTRSSESDTARAAAADVDTTAGDTAAIAVGADTGTQTAPAVPPQATSPRTTTDAMLPLWLSCKPGLEAYYRMLPERDRNSVPKCVTVFGRAVAVWDEQRLLFLVILAGALGAMVHGMRSLAMYIGNRQLAWSWVAYYFVLPFSGAAVAVVFYLVIRGGFFSPTSDFSQTSPFGFAAFAAIVGLFSQNAVLKLKAIAETMFERMPAESSSLGAESGTAPTIAKLERTSAVEGAREDVVEVYGADFVKDSRVEVNGKARPPEFVSDKLLRLVLEPAELAVLENGGTLSVVVVNPDDARSDALTITD